MSNGRGKKRLGSLMKKIGGFTPLGAIANGVIKRRIQKNIGKQIAGHTQPLNMSVDQDAPAGEAENDNKRVNLGQVLEVGSDVLNAGKQILDKVSDVKQGDNSQADADSTNADAGTKPKANGKPSPMDWLKLHWWKVAIGAVVVGGAIYFLKKKK
jgi:hypothetical protein